MKKEEWEKVKKPYDKYSVSNKGRVRNDETGYVFCNNSKVSGYIRVRLSFNNKVRTTLVHRLVAESFLDKKSGCDFVDHIDRNRENNNVENLRWVNGKENAKNRKHDHSKSRSVLQYDLNGKFIKRYERIIDTPFGRSNVSSACSGHLETAYGYVWKYADTEFLEGEIFKIVVFNEQKIKVSNKGRIRLPSGKISYGHNGGNGYKSVTIDDKGVRLHRLIAEAFLPKSKGKDLVNHKDHNRSNNNVENLEWTTSSENRKHAKKAYRNTYKRKIKSTDINGKIKSFESVTEAHRQTGISSGNICMVCKGKRKTAGGFKWTYA